jgi:hypothetical protein
MANIRSALPEDISNVSREVKPIRLRALVRIRAQPGRVRLSRCSSRMFFNRETLELWCLEVRHGIDRPALLDGRYLLLPFMIFLLWANLSNTFCMGEKSFLVSGKAAVQWCSLEEIRLLEIKFRPLIVSFLVLLSKDSIMFVNLFFSSLSLAIAPDRRSSGTIMFPRKVKLSEKLSLLSP